MGQCVSSRAKRGARPEPVQAQLDHDRPAEEASTMLDALPQSQPSAGHQHTRQGNIHHMAQPAPLHSCTLSHQLTNTASLPVADGLCMAGARDLGSFESQMRTWNGNHQAVHNAVPVCRASDSCMYASSRGSSLIASTVQELRSAIAIQVSVASLLASAASGMMQSAAEMAEVQEQLMPEHPATVAGNGQPLSASILQLQATLPFQQQPAVTPPNHPAAPLISRAATCGPSALQPCSNGPEGSAGGQRARLAHVYSSPLDTPDLPAPTGGLATSSQQHNLAHQLAHLMPLHLSCPPADNAFAKPAAPLNGVLASPAVTSNGSSGIALLPFTLPLPLKLSATNTAVTPPPPARAAPSIARPAVVHAPRQGPAQPSVPPAVRAQQPHKPHHTPPAVSTTGLPSNTFPGLPMAFQAAGLPEQQLPAADLDFMPRSTLRPPTQCSTMSTNSTLFLEELCGLDRI